MNKKKLLISLVVAANVAFACFAMREAFAPFFTRCAKSSCCAGHHDHCHHEHGHAH